MWLLSPRLGLLSIVVADDPQTGLPNPEMVMIRARRRGHLVLLQEAHPVLASHGIIESGSGHDYRYRLVVPKAVFATAVAEMVMDLDWRNVKSEAARRQDELGADYVAALHDVHGVLRRALDDV